MINKIIERCKELMDDMEISFVEVTKNNEIVKQGIRIRKKDSNIFAVAYLDDIKKVLGDNMTVENACTYIKDILSNQLNIEIAIEDIQDWDCMKRCIRKKVVNYKRNRFRLQDKVHRRNLDLAEVCYICLDLQGQKASAEIPIQVATDFWNVSEELIFQTAENNMAEEGYYIRPIEDMLKLPDFIPSSGLYAVTNKNGEFGAGIIANPSLLHELVKDMKGNFYILPSSVHELVLQEASMKDTIDDMRELVKEVNDTCVSAREFLSYNVYFYNAVTGEISVC